MLREQPGLHQAAASYLVAARHADVREVITNHQAFGQGNFVRNIQLYYGPGFDPMQHSSYRWLSEVFVMQDPPAHTRLRKLVAFALTPKRVAAMQPRIEQIVDGLLDAGGAAGRDGTALGFRLPAADARHVRHARARGARAHTWQHGTSHQGRGTVVHRLRDASR